MAAVYNYGYSPFNVYGHVVALLREHLGGAGLHIDVGCGYGAIAEHLRDELGLTYLGFDMADDGLASLRERGFETRQIDLSDPEKVETIIWNAVGDRRIASLTFIDTLEHIVNGAEVIAMLRRLAEKSGAALILSVPNISHKDVALKLLSGHWDVTEAGLLDHTHVECYTNARLARLMEVGGWRQIGANDVHYESSDQRFPVTELTLDASVPLGDFLRRLLEDANPHLTVNQFVRAYRADQPKNISLWDDRSEAAGPQFSLLIAIREDIGPRNGRVYDALARQTNQFYQLIVVRYGDNAAAVSDVAAAWPQVLRDRALVVRSAATSRAEALNEGLGHASGRHLVVLREDDLVEPDWLDALSELTVQGPRAVLRVGARSRAPLARISDVLPFDLGILECPAAYALPIGVFKHLGLRFDATTQPKEEAYVVARAIVDCGVSASDRLLVTPQSTSDDSVASAENLASFESILSKLDQHALLLPQGSAKKLDRLSGDYNKIPVRHIGDFVGNLSRGFDECYSRIASHKFVAKAQVSKQERPFLSILTRTTGIRAGTLRDTLMSLAGQRSQDFELVIVVQSSLDESMNRVRALIAEFPPSFGARTNIIRCERQGRSAPLNDALAYVSGRYVAVLDDADFVFAHWIATFERLSYEKPGSLLRTVCARQDFAATGIGAAAFPRASSWFKMEWPSSYDAVKHLHRNYTPSMSIAFPLECFRDLNLRWDETLDSSGDWPLLNHAAMNCGVVSGPEVTSVYRWWIQPESSESERDMIEWSANRRRILVSFDNQPLLLPPGAAGEICGLIETGEHLQIELCASQQQNEKLEAYLRHVEGTAEYNRRRLAEVERRESDLINILGQTQTELDSLASSTSWRITGPLRSTARLIPARLLLQLRRLMKALWWMVTPWAIPRRLRALRDRKKRPH